ncbi:MAG: TonB-dependent receptor [Bacteroidetes bacterium]|nr:TonB-dependent receptor [Bacteroidota bacterium]
MNKLKSILLPLFLFAGILAYAQSGTIRGTVYDANTGEFLPGVTIYIESISHGTITDLDGKFNLKVAPGTYNLKISFISYETVVMEGLKVESEEVTLINDVGLKEATFEIASAVVTAKAVRNTETALLALKHKSPNVFDGISAASLRRTGDSDAASSIKRVTGVSVSNGKYVYVRGLGDRYTKTILNGVDVPGLDPDRNTIQMDIFPTNIIDNIIVHKTFSAELPADFTGGAVDIELKDFPEEKKGNISISAGYNPNFHFKDNYLTYEGGSTDFLGFDDGSRDAPATSNIPQFAEVFMDPESEQGLRYREILEGFNPNMSAIKEKSLMNYGLGVSFGNQKVREKVTIGYNFALSYKNETEFYENAKYGKYSQLGDKSITELNPDNLSNGPLGKNNVFLSGLAGFAVKTAHSKYRINLIHLQNGESGAGIFDFVSDDRGTTFTAYQHVLEYTQRSLTNLFIEGKHKKIESNWEVLWKLSPTLSKIEDPDNRFTRYVYRSTGLEIGTETGFPERTWRDLNEINLGGVFHVTRKFTFKGEDAKLKFGGAYTYKDREFDVFTYSINVRNMTNLTGNPDELFYEENLWPYLGDPQNGIAYDANFIPVNTNQYDANVNYAAVYVSGELNILKKLKSVIGLRAENYTQRYTGSDQSRTKVFENDKVLDDFDIFPAVNLVYSLSDEQNIRVSYSKTIARPSLKELSYAQIFDPVSGVTFIGGLADDKGYDIEGNYVVFWDGDLKSSSVHNFDLRWEWFHERGQMISLSGFYKQFLNPIEMVQFATTQKTQIQPRNVGDGEVYGAEFEFRQGLSFLGHRFENFSVNSNFTYAYSEIELTQTEYESRLLNARVGESVDKTRSLAGLSPYVINAGLLYNGSTSDGIWKNLQAGLFYNVQGETLTIVGMASKPDIYTLPFHSLNFTLNKEFNGIGLGIKVNNILNNKSEKVYQAYGAQDQYYELLEKGRSYSISLKYNF